MNRDDFPVLKNNPGLIYLDSANTTLKPQCVADAVNAYYTTYSANIGRTSYGLSEKATLEYEDARVKVARFIDANPDEIIFTQSASYAINQIARGIQNLLRPGDQILLTRHEHNSNLLIWYQLAKEVGVKISLVEDLVDDDDISKIRLFSYSLVDNTAGELYDYTNLVRRLKEQGSMIAVDISQAVAHLPLSVRQLDCDFAVFSGHKMYGPSGVGVLYVRQGLQPQIKPLVYGSQTFASLDTANDQFTLLDSPAKFEPGTPNIEGVIGLGTAVDYLASSNVGDKGKSRQLNPQFYQHEKQLTQHYHKKANALNLDDYMFRDSPVTIGVATLAHPSIHPHDIALLMDERYHIAARAGKACADLVANGAHERRGFLRASFGIYTTTDDIDKFLTAYREIIDELR